MQIRKGVLGFKGKDWNFFLVDTFAYQNSTWPVREWTTVQLGIWPARCSPINDRTVLEPSIGGVLLTIIPETPWLSEVLGLFRSCGWHMLERSASTAGQLFLLYSWLIVAAIPPVVSQSPGLRLGRWRAHLSPHYPLMIWIPYNCPLPHKLPSILDWTRASVFLVACCIK